MIYDIHHRSDVRYDPAVNNARFNLRLLPVEWPGQTVLAEKLTWSPPAETYGELRGPYLVRTTRLQYAEPIGQLSFEYTLRIEVAPSPPPDSSPSLAKVRAAAIASVDPGPGAPSPYLFASRVAGFDQAITDWAADFLDSGRDIVAAARDLNSAIHQRIAFNCGMTTSKTLPGEAFRDGHGVCQDLAHIMIVALRTHGVPAAYLSGYLRTVPPPGMARLVGADAMHAWVNVWCGPDIGWIALDPTNDCIAGEDHIVVAMGRDYADVAPIDGVFVGSSTQHMTYAVDVVEA